MATIELDLKTAIELFVAEFSVFEKHFVGVALRSLSSDMSFVGHAERLLDLEARLTLLKRMAIVRRVDPELIVQLEDVQLRAANLREKRDELSQVLDLLAADKRASRVNRNRTAQDDCDFDGIVPRPHRAWVPTVGEIDECRKVTNRLQTKLGSIAAQFNRGTS
ncbi:MAG TPA: hypothetical protein VGI32_10030 [Steroidobacteraceae bacterium]|jgi:hypothetical protein